MSDFIIPKGRDFEFTIKVIEADSFIAQDLTNVVGIPTLKLATKLVPDVAVVTVNLSVVDAVNGMLTGTILAATTSTLEYSRGPIEDRYYLKPLYIGVVEVDPGDVPIVITTIEDVYVTPTGV